MGQWLERRSMPTPRHDLQSVAVNGSIYDFAGDSWTAAEPMPVGKAWLDACTVGDRLFAMGGAYSLPGGGFKWIHDLHEYVP